MNEKLEHLQRLVCDFETLYAHARVYAQVPLAPGAQIAHEGFAATPSLYAWINDGQTRVRLFNAPPHVLVRGAAKLPLLASLIEARMEEAAKFHDVVMSEADEATSKLEKFLQRKGVRNADTLS